MGQIIILTTMEELHAAILSTFEQIENEKKAHQQPPKLYSINGVAKLLGKAHLTVKKLIKDGMIQTTLDGKITGDALNRYLNNII